MNSLIRMHRAVGRMLLVAFAGMTIAAGPSAHLKGDEASSYTTMADGITADGGSAECGIQEKEKPAQAIKHKRFPWLWIVAGLAVTGFVIYTNFIHKHKYDLTVATGVGVSGNPNTGVYSYRQGQEVDYSFTLQPGYTHLQVILDGREIAAAGKIKIERNMTLSVSADENFYKGKIEGEWIMKLTSTMGAMGKAPITVYGVFIYYTETHGWVFLTFPNDYHAQNRVWIDGAYFDFNDGNNRYAFMGHMLDANHMVGRWSLMTGGETAWLVDEGTWTGTRK